MKKNIGLLTVLIGILILTACDNSKTEIIENNKTNPVLPLVQDSQSKKDEEKVISPPDLETEEGVREYLIGEWQCSMEYISNIVANMTIYEDLDFELSFYDSYTNEAKGDYKGSIVFKRIYRDPDDAPDMITLQFDDDNYTESDYYFFHRTIYDGKRVMSLFFAGAYDSVSDTLSFEGRYNSIFDILIGDNDGEYNISHIMLEKTTGEATQENPQKNDDFYAVFWGDGVPYESIWLDAVEWTPGEEGYDPNYPVPMVVNENEEAESVLYKIDQDRKFEILGDDIFKGDVYYVETDEKGNIISLIGAEYKEFLEESSQEYLDEIKEMIFFIVEDIGEIQEYLDNGMSVLFTGETIIIDGQECYEIDLGTNHDDAFIRELHYAVNINTEQVYEYDVLNDQWEEK